MNEAWGHSNLMTSRSLAKLGEIGGPRCCKRNSYMSILTAIDYAEEITGVRMHKPRIVCRHMSSNSQCMHIGFDDPDSFTGSEEQVLKEFRRVRDEIRSAMSKLM